MTTPIYAGKYLTVLRRGSILVHFRHQDALAAIRHYIRFCQRTKARVERDAKYFVVELIARIMVEVVKQPGPVQPWDHQLRDTKPLERRMLRVPCCGCCPLRVGVHGENLFATMLADKVLTPDVLFAQYVPVTARFSDDAVARHRPLVLC